MISLAHALRLKVVAEGVETQQQLARLREIGCNFAQGYHFSRPQPIEAATSLLAKGTLP
jgi:EAL domain-containing protein (putative c-di-GMP-specific phosphodiesterase class I)